MSVRPGVSPGGAFLGRLPPLAEHRNNRDRAVTLRLDPAEMLALYGFLALGSHYAAAVSGESSQFSSDEVRTYTAAISTGAARTLIDKISVAAVGIHNEPEMRILEDLAPPSDGGEHYREVAGKLRLLARQIRLPNVRQEILNLAIRYEQRGHHFDMCARASDPDPPGSC
jgi:hypothetical protein